MRRKELARLEELAIEAVSRSGVDFIDLEYSAGGTPVLRLFIDKDGGITIDDCARVSRAMGDALDTEDPLPYSYRLEVSSPGVDKALKGERHYERYSGRNAVFVLKRPYDGHTTLSGEIGGCEEGAVILCTKSGETIKIEFDDVARARLDEDPWEIAKVKRKKGHAG